MIRYAKNPEPTTRMPRSCSGARRGLLHRCLALAAASTFLVSGVAPAADEPGFNRQVSFLVPFAAGGTLDFTARVIAERFKEIAGVPVVVTNRPGAGGSVATRTLAAAPADGHTLFFSSGSGFGLLHLLVPGYTMGLDDFETVARVSTNNSVFVVNAKVPARTLSELLDFASSRKGVVNFCTTGANGLNHLQLEMLRSLVKSKRPDAVFEPVHVPYNGLAPALIALRAGDVDVCALPYAGVVKNLDGKDIRIIAVQTAKRLPQMPDVQTTGEQGFAEMDENESPVVVMALKGTPAPMLRKLESTIRESLSDPDVHRRLDEAELQPGFVGRADTSARLAADVARYTRIIREANLAQKN
jgi:tripartite-type tricarboxylate transporter receptor subunit TctC